MRSNQTQTRSDRITLSGRQRGAAMRQRLPCSRWSGAGRFSARNVRCRIQSWSYSATSCTGWRTWQLRRSLTSGRDAGKPLPLRTSPKSGRLTAETGLDTAKTPLPSKTRRLCSPRMTGRRLRSERPSWSWTAGLTATGQSDIPSPTSGDGNTKPKDKESRQ